MVEEIKKELLEFRAEQLPSYNSPYHYQSEIWSGLELFIEWLEKKNTNLGS
jgi:hypothetical protein